MIKRLMDDLIKLNQEKKMLLEKVRKLKDEIKDLKEEMKYDAWENDFLTRQNDKFKKELEKLKGRTLDEDEELPKYRIKNLTIDNVIDYWGGKGTINIEPEEEVDNG